AKLCLPPSYNNQLFAQVLDMFKQNRHLPYVAATACVFTIDFRAILDKIHVPTLIIVGELDVMTPIQSAQYLHTHIRNSKLYIIPQTGHLTNLENPVLFNNRLRKFLQELYSSS
ncbi:MAG: alpha/beta hydrolase, partial [Burkholderiales bacterium]|nr:alpha/beta hydrolase [Burkholderiales bacterium]